MDGPAEEEIAFKLKLKPRTQKTKDQLVKAKKNHLILINTKSNKTLKVILDYLGAKFDINAN